MAEGAAHAQRDALEGRVEAPQQAARAHLGTEQAQLGGARVGELEVVHAHDAHPMRVDDLLVKDVAGEKDLVRLQVREAQVRGDDLEMDLVLVVGVHVLAPADHDRRAPLAHEGQARDAGEDLARGDAKVGDRADLLAVGVKYGVAQELGQVDHSCSLRASLTGAPQGTPQVIDCEVEVSCGPFS